MFYLNIFNNLILFILAPFFLFASCAYSGQTIFSEDITVSSPKLILSILPKTPLKQKLQKPSKKTRRDQLERKVITKQDAASFPEILKLASSVGKIVIYSKQGEMNYAAAAHMGDDIVVAHARIFDKILIKQDIQSQSGPLLIDLYQECVEWEYEPIGLKNNRSMRVTSMLIDSAYIAELKKNGTSEHTKNDLIFLMFQNYSKQKFPVFKLRNEMVRFDDASFIYQMLDQEVVPDGNAKCIDYNYKLTIYDMDEMRSAAQALLSKNSKKKTGLKQWEESPEALRIRDILYGPPRYIDFEKLHDEPQYKSLYDIESLMGFLRHESFMLDFKHGFGISQ